MGNIHNDSRSVGVDVNAILSKIGLMGQVNGATSEQIGRVAIAYAAHKVRHEIHALADWHYSAGSDGGS